jgi:hypothetical protein
MVMIRSKRRIKGRNIGGFQERAIPIPKRCYLDNYVANQQHYLRSPGYVWQVIDGPEYLNGRLMSKQLLWSGGWFNGDLIARNIQTGETITIKDSIEAVI